MENAEEIFHSLDDFSKRKPKTIPQELNEYLAYVARTGDPVYQWSLVKSLFKEKLLNVITDFYETTPGIVIPPYPNVDPFNYDIMKNSLLERLDSFTSAPFTVQRLCELLTFPRKQYNRVDKFMRAIEKNILVVSTREPGIQRHSESENGEANEPIVNGSDNNSEYHVDVEMDDISRKENNDQWTNEPQPGSSDTHISVDDIEARLKAKEDTPIDTQDKKTTEYESVTPPELNVTTDDSTELKPIETSPKSESQEAISDKEETFNEVLEAPTATEENKDEEIKAESTLAQTDSTLVIPEIRVDDAEMTEQKLLEQATTNKQADAEIESENTINMECKESKSAVEIIQVCCDESSSDSKDDSETKLISEVSTSSEESSSSSDNTDGSSNSPKTDEGHIDILEESSQTDIIVEVPEEPELLKISEPDMKELSPSKPNASDKIESEAYSISDVQSVLPAVVEKLTDNPAVSTEPTVTEEKNNENVNDIETEKKEI